MPSKNLLLSQPYPKTHEEMLQYDLSKNDMEKLYNKNLSHHYDYKDDDDYNYSSGSYNSSGINQSIYDRYYFQTHADGYLGRAIITNDDLEFSLWASKNKSMYATNKIQQIAKQLAEYFNVQNLTFHVPQEIFDVSTPKIYKQKVIHFQYNPDKDTIKKVNSPAEPKPKPIANPEHNIKKYEINGEKYSLNDLGNKRKELHLKGARNIDPILCNIDEKKYPELKGYKPMNCPKEQITKPKLNPWTVKRSPEDWKGIPINRLTSENLSFKNYVKNRDNTKNI
jgi:hypothetical protein